jgi:two-component system, sensor histidine kinase and response regulator
MEDKLSTSSTKAQRILLAEDNVVNAKLLEASLKKYGHKIAVASDGIEVLEILKNSDFDIILMDLEMPRMDGLEAARLIRSGETGNKNRNIPILAITAYVHKEILNQCREVGMNDYITKPVDIKELASVVANPEKLQTIQQKF